MLEKKESSVCSEIEVRDDDKCLTEYLIPEANTQICGLSQTYYLTITPQVASPHYLSFSLPTVRLSNILLILHFLIFVVCSDGCYRTPESEWLKSLQPGYQLDQREDVLLDQG